MPLSIGTTAKRMAIALVLAILACCALFLCGCTDENGDIPDKREVEAKVHTECPTERITLISVDSEDSVPKKDTYHYSSKDRDLTFDAVSTLSRISIDATVTDWYSKSISCNYKQAVIRFYSDQVTAVERQSGLSRDQRSGLCISSYTDLAVAAQTICNVADVFAQERSYNTEEWIARNMDGGISVWALANDSNKPVVIATPSYLNSDYDQILHQLEMQYARAVAEGRVAPDPTIPSSVTSQVHRQKIDAITVKDTQLDDKMANALGTEYNPGKNVFTADYDYDLTDYTVKLDAGITGAECGPHPLAVYVEAAGGSFHMDYGKGRARWTIGEDKFTLTATKGSDDRVKSFTVTRNGNALDIHWKQSSSETFMVRVPVNDLGLMLHCIPLADEANSTIQFI